MFSSSRPFRSPLQPSDTGHSFPRFRSLSTLTVTKQPSKAAVTVAKKISNDENLSLRQYSSNLHSDAITPVVYFVLRIIVNASGWWLHYEEDAASKLWAMKRKRSRTDVLDCHWSKALGLKACGILLGRRTPHWFGSEPRLQSSRRSAEWSVRTMGCCRQ